MLLEAERDANELQVKYTPSEMVKLGREIEARKKAEDQERFGSKQGVGGGGDKRSASAKSSITSTSGDVEVIDSNGLKRNQRPNERLNDAIGEALGTSGVTYKRMKDVHLIAPLTAYQTHLKVTGPTLNSNPSETLSNTHRNKPQQFTKPTPKT